MPEHAQSRVSSFDALGSFVLSPIGAAIAVPVALALGSSGALTLASGALVACRPATLLIPAVWTIRPLPDSRIVATTVA